MSSRSSIAVPRVRCGCAGWSIPAADRAAFGDGASVLQRYATRFDAVEINSSFHRPHRAGTYARWADSVPEDFRFSVKLPRSISHDARLHAAGPLLDAFLAQAGALGTRLGCLLLQLPPSAAFDARVAASFFAMLRRRWDGGVVCEPRHASWFLPQAQALLTRHRIARCAADPSPVPEAATPSPTAGPYYWRWHGAQRIYYSSYDDNALQALADAMRHTPHDGTHPQAERWVIFDNTAAGLAVPNALRLQRLLGTERKR
ncbi:DUF72 domain-containing protein [Xanthomonas hortorum]|uniref:DUF72 domain-containing protein n=1 Tax=Xanthomonas hortorum pv. gardneri TaxID=2754056 RepID=A0A6V7BWS8_9XANT|nr:DUF72 domain-containing protein [Xanthomonas hortorum]APP81957.1 hypothetical protein BJD10_21765 [Xanthomonas hortorum pv. gardneri]EGD21035.1 hypothetical protein XGA_0264 [Xanthomonas hortorum ATCC 19865]KLA95856.1 hypothetical protein SM17710_16860 [Xanthomonas hortorum pv. gardneri]KLB01551.1 hypothetical protein SM19410_02850 [Xanthomonas hortorum pv. gardneri]KLB05273.1 hypothetical protein SM18210_04020 [Xanthomonas hortorum pv. gardneri]